MNSQNKEGKENREAKSEEESQKEHCCCPEGMAEMKAKCCKGMAGAICCKRMTRACRWLPLIPVVLAGAAFLLGYYLSPGSVRVLWLAISGAVILLTCLGVILAKASCRA